MVGARRAALVAGAVVAVCVAVVFGVRTVPDRVVSLLGGPKGGVERWGGVRIVYEPPAGADAEVEAYLGARADARRQGSELVLEFPGTAIDDVTVAGLVDVLVAGGLAMKVVRDDDWATPIARDNPLVVVDDGRDPDAAVDPRVRLEPDYWRSEEGDTHHSMFLSGESRQQIEAAIAHATARGIQLPPGTSVGFETYEPYRPDEDNARAARPRVRTYLLDNRVEIDGTMIASAVGSFEPNTGRPIVLLDFTAEGGERFCELTRRMRGGKLATLLGGQVRSAPVINGAICGGRASITMGGSDPDRQLRERDVIADVLSNGALPPGGKIRDLAKFTIPDTSVPVMLGRLLLGLLAGLGAALVTFAVVRYARPSLAPRTHAFAGAVPWKRVLVTALAPLALIIGGRLNMPGVDVDELAHVMRGASTEPWSAIGLGLAPILLAYVLVELAALAVPALRWRRHDPQGRIALGRATAMLAILLALGHAYLVVRNLESASAYGADFVIANPGWKFRAIAMLSLVAGTLILAAIAGVISEHGLGNGYGVVIGSGIVLDLIPELGSLGLEYVLALVTFLAIAAFAMVVLRWRIVDGKQPAARVPASGISPLVDTAGAISLVFALTGLAANATLFDLLIWSNKLHEPAIRFAVIAISIPIWAWIFARPSVVARVALQGGLEPPSRASWLRGVAVSALLLGGAAVLAFAVPTERADGGVTPAILRVDPVSALLFGAVLLDAIAEARAHRTRLAVAGVVHQVQYLGAIEHALVDANLPYHLHASHLRSLLAFFGPWAPVHVMVAEDRAIEARLVIDNIVRAARTTVPAASVVR